MDKVPLSFFQTNNVQNIAQNLLGKTIYTNISGKITSAIITETEAYQGPEDNASHAYNNKRTTRTEVMYKTGGYCYIYLCYGIHYLFNIVTNVHDIPHAILIRSGKKHSGIEYIQERRGAHIQTSKLLKGPGNFTKGLGIDMKLNGVKLNTKHIWITNNEIQNSCITKTQRVGVDYAGEDALLPWRYILQD
mgnify:CR=1 FL=1